MNDAIIEKFLAGISSFKEQIEEVYLFGSRCRDDWRPDSDYDILIVVRRKEKEIVDRLYDVVMDILLSTGRLISLKIFAATEFNRLRAIPTPFISNILREGKKIGSHDQGFNQRLHAKG